MVQSTLTSKGQTTVPLPIRKMLGLKPNMKIFWISLRPGEVSIIVPPLKNKESDWIQTMCGILANKDYDAVDWLLKEKKKEIELEKKLLKN